MNAMKKGFSISCIKCNEKMDFNENFIMEKDDSKLTITVMGYSSIKSLYIVCSNCGNELEIEL